MLSLHFWQPAAEALGVRAQQLASPLQGFLHTPRLGTHLISSPLCMQESSCSDLSFVLEYLYIRKKNAFKTASY